MSLQRRSRIDMHIRAAFLATQVPVVPCWQWASNESIEMREEGNIEAARPQAYLGYQDVTRCD